MQAATGRWHYYRRTVRLAAALVGVGALTLSTAGTGSAAPADAEEFNRGTGSAIAHGYKVNPVFGNLSFGITAGLSIAGHQNTAAQAISRAVDTGVIGQTMAGEGCSGGDPTWAKEDQPQEVMAESDDPKAADGYEGEEFGSIHQFARATPSPFGESITTIMPLGDSRVAEIRGGRTISYSGVMDGPVREAKAITQLGTVELLDGLVQIGDMTWEATHRSGDEGEDQTVGRFSMGSLTIDGEPQSMSGDEAQQLEELNVVLHELGFQVTMPRVRVEEGIVFVDPLKLGVIPSDNRDTVLGPIFEAVQPFREQLTEAMLEQSCSNATYITVLDIALGSFSGAGSLNLELGGVQATTAAIDAFEFGEMPPMPDFDAMPPVVEMPDAPPDPPADLPAFDDSAAPDMGGAVSTGFEDDSSFSTGTGGTTVTSEVVTTGGGSGDGGGSEDGGGGGDEVAAMPTEPIAGLAGARGGWLAAISGLGLALLLVTAEGDRRKMRRALRDIPLEA